MRAQWLNDAIGGLDGVGCPVCRNKGYTAESRDGRIVCVECECMARRRSVARIEKSGLGDMLERYTFDSYQTPEPWQKTAKQKATDYLSDNSGKWFVAAGAVGSGKSHLCTAICGELLNAGLEVRYMLWRDDGGRIKAAVNDSAEYHRLLDPLKTVQVLYIDDFFKAKDGKPQSGDVNLAFELLNYRYNRTDLVTIISTELTVEQILDVDQAVGSRIYQRCKEYYLKITGSGKNWRLRR